MKKKPNNAEDKLFKAAFSRPEITRELLTKMAGPELNNALRLDSLELSNASYIDKDLSEHFADLVFTCKTTEEKSVNIVLLMEHKSYMPPYPPFQILGYLHNVWRQQIKSKRKPTPIVPLLFYHGKEAWKQQSWMGYLEGGSAVFEPFTPNGGYLLVDLSGLADEVIYQFRYGFMKTVLMLMKHRLERDYLLENLTYILNFVEEEIEMEVRIEDFHILLRYLTASVALDWEEVSERAQPLFKTNHAMTVLEEFIIDFKKEGLKQGRKQGREEGRVEGLEEGRKEGRKEGREEGREEGYALKTKEMVKSLIENFPDQTNEKIALVAKVDINYVKQTRLEMSQPKKAAKRKKG